MQVNMIGTSTSSFVEVFFFVRRKSAASSTAGTTLNILGNRRGSATFSGAASTAISRGPTRDKEPMPSGMR
jgi:hypothetical protein